MRVIDLLRHGEVAQIGICAGAGSDPPLTEAGRAAVLASLPSPVPWGAIVSSPLRRCADLAEELAKETGLPLRLDPRLREIHFGDWEGRAWTEIAALQGDRLHDFFRNPRRFPPPAGEPYAAFERRILEAWEDLLLRSAIPHVLAITHGGVVRVVVRQVLGLPVERLSAVGVTPASGTRIRCEAGCVPLLLYHGGPLCSAPSTGLP
jgi:broad specificity phosphatase PhoE